MGIKRYTAYKDNTITNAFEPNLQTRATGANMGLADSLAVFSIFAQESSASLEASRVLVQFPVSSSDTGTTILADRAAGKIPVSGSVNFYLRLFNVATGQTLPKDFTLNVSPVSQSWEEGYGLDMDEYKDQTYGGTGSNWINARAHTAWTNEGGDYLTASVYANYNYAQTFYDGTEDLKIDITDLVEQWITGTAGGGYENYGVGVFLTCSQELCQPPNPSSRSYYTKHFSARESEFFFSRPIIEAQWDSTRKDNRGNFIVSSSALNAADNLNNLYLYNYVRGQPTDINGIGTGSIYVRIYTSSSAGQEIATTPNSPVTGAWVAPGLYSASFAIDTTQEVVYDRWFNAAGSVVYRTASFMPQTFSPSDIFNIPKYVTSITNLLSSYCREDINRMRVFTREKNWNDTIYTRAVAAVQLTVVDDAYYKIFRVVDGKTVIDYGTGSINHTRLSYDSSGSYFDLDMSLLEAGYKYGIKFAYLTNTIYEEQPDIFTFKVE